MYPFTRFRNASTSTTKHNLSCYDVPYNIIHSGEVMGERLWNGALPLAARRTIKSHSGKFNQINCGHPPRTGPRNARSYRDILKTELGLFFFLYIHIYIYFCKALDIYYNIMKERRNNQPLVVRCKLVLVGDVQCGKTAMLQVLAKDCYPEVCEHRTEFTKL